MNGQQRLNHTNIIIISWKVIVHCLTQQSIHLYISPKIQKFEAQHHVASIMIRLILTLTKTHKTSILFHRHCQSDWSYNTENRLIIISVHTSEGLFLSMNKFSTSPKTSNRPKLKLILSDLMNRVHIIWTEKYKNNICIGQSVNRMVAIKYARYWNRSQWN